MQAIFQPVYEMLLDQLQKCQSQKLPFPKEVEHCFGIAERHWRALQILLSRFLFQTDEQEIDFFKNHKPKITSRVEYYSLLYHSLLFKPKCRKEEENFWFRELGRLKKWEAEHKQFFTYHKSGKTNKDAFYFLRCHYNRASISDAKVYDADAASLTNGDPLLSTHIALSRYTAYVREKLSELSGDRL